MDGMYPPGYNGGRVVQGVFNPPITNDGPERALRIEGAAEHKSSHGKIKSDLRFEASQQDIRLSVPYRQVETLLLDAHDQHASKSIRTLNH